MKCVGFVLSFLARSFRPIVWTLVALGFSPALALSGDGLLQSISLTLSKPTNASAPSDEQVSDRYRVVKKQIAPKQSATRKPANVIPTKEQVVESLIDGDKSQQLKDLPQLGDYSEDLSIDKRLEHLILGGDFKELQAMRRALPASDIRRTLVEINVGGVYAYNSSQSNSWYRDYHQPFPGLALGATAWVTPYLAVSSTLRTSIGSSIKNSVVGNTTTPTSNQWLNVGLRFRRFQGKAPHSPYFILGVDFSSYEMKVPQDDLRRVCLHSSGLRLSYDQFLPMNSKYTWTLGIEILPYLRHEERKTGVDLRSGTRSESHALGLSLGGRFEVDESNTIYWTGSQRLERNLYTGASNQVDPAWGTTLDGVTVNNSVSALEFGFIWRY